MSRAQSAGALARRVALNPLAWILREDGVELLDRDRLPGVLGEVRAAGFDAVMADVPADLSVTEYRALLDDAGLRPAPGYFAAAFEDTGALPEILDSARRSAAEQAELGLTEVFVAGAMVPARLALPGVGAGFDEGRLATFTANLGGVALAMVAEGVRPCFHPHVGTLVEIEREVRFLLDHSDPRLLDFGPDTGHLFWAGMDPEVVIGDYADRVGAVHVKDVHRAVRAQAREDRVDYGEATFGRHLWTEPGRGDVDLTAVIDVLHDHTGWWVVEVDVPDRTTPARSAALSAAWVAEHLTAQRTEGVCP